MNRGSADPLLHSVRRHLPFNEAPIHESGKLDSLVRGRAAVRAFNEAPIHESGKFQLDDVRRADQLCLQ